MFSETLRSYCKVKKLNSETAMSHVTFEGVTLERYAQFEVFSIPLFHLTYPRYKTTRAQITA